MNVHKDRCALRRSRPCPPSDDVLHHVHLEVCLVDVRYLGGGRRLSGHTPVSVDEGVPSLNPLRQLLDVSTSLQMTNMRTQAKAGRESYNIE